MCRTSYTRWEIGEWVCYAGRHRISLSLRSWQRVHAMDWNKSHVSRSQCVPLTQSRRVGGLCLAAQQHDE